MPAKVMLLLLLSANGQSMLRNSRVKKVHTKFKKQVSLTSDIFIL